MNHGFITYEQLQYYFAVGEEFYTTQSIFRERPVDKPWVEDAGRLATVLDQRQTVRIYLYIFRSTDLSEMCPTILAY